jgi:predicted ATPase/class 3 adenylate cyclase/tetratricopeptide (TPR) repeat protein
MATVTFLFTDVAGSTRLWEEAPDAMAVALSRHDALAKEIAAAHGGTVVRSRGEGDSLFITFEDAGIGVAAATALQLAFSREPWPDGAPLRVRMALHSGIAEIRDGDHYGSVVNRAARLRSIAHPGQILLSEHTRDLVGPPESAFQPLGEHRLRDLEQPERVFQVLHPDLPSAFPPLLSLNVELTNLSAEISTFVGRTRELAEISARLEESRLLTLTGSGGCGKTRLALRVAGESFARFPDGIWLVELAPVADPALVPQALATVLGVREPPDKTCIEALVAHLARRRTLLVFDNCEHVLDATVRLAETLLRSCGDVTILASSREPLGITGESTYRVPSLSLPRSGEAITVDELAGSEASQLFLARARLHRPDLELTAANAASVASVCRRLDGIPFALELAAARLRTLSIEELNRRLDQRFRLLVGGSKSALPRQQTLRALIDWSFALLNPAERLLLCRLSVFSGGWTLEAAERVTPGESPMGTVLDDFEVIDVLQSLVDKSLVTVETERDGVRYGLLETVRQYARERLVELDDPETVLRRHRAYFVEFVESLAPLYPAPTPAGALRPLEPEQDNLRQAMTTCLEDPYSGGLGLRLGMVMGNFWIGKGYWTEIQRMLIALLDHPGGSDEWIPRGRACCGLAGLFSSQGADTAARDYSLRSLEYFRRAEEPSGSAKALSALATAETNLGEFDAARDHLGEALEAARAAGDRRRLAYATCELGFLAFACGDGELAMREYREGRRLFREAGLETDYLAWNNSVAVCEYRRGDYAAAAALWREGLRCHYAAFDQPRICIDMSGLAMIASLNGRRESAAQLYGAASAIGDRIGITFFSGERALREQARRATEKEMGAAEFARRFAEGRALPLDDAVRLALEGIE